MHKRYLGGLVAAVLVVGAIAATPGTGHAAPGAVAAKPDPGKAAQSLARQLIASKAPQLKVGAHDTFQALPVASTSKLTYAAYQRSFRGLPVIGGDFVVVTDAQGRYVTTSVAQTRRVKLASTTPRLGAGRAAALARTRLDRVTGTGSTRLVVWQGRRSHLAFETRVSGVAKGELSSQTVYVDARTGQILDAIEHVAHGSGTAAYSGPNPVALDTVKSGSTYYLQDPNATTLVCQNASGNTTFSGSDDLWGDGNATNRETGCVDGLYAAETERHMLSDWLGRNGMNGSGGWVPLRVGLNDVNAYYDGTQVQIGHNNAGQWISSIDVVAHEYGHGIDDKTPGGISRSGTQEFVADVFGALTEWYSNQSSPYDVPDFLVGEEVDLVGQGPIRNMYNPSALGDPNCYSSSIPSTEVHAAAGPGNHWFYLLAMGSNPGGGQPSSTTCNGASVTGIGVQKAGQIFYNAMLMKTTTSSYLKYRTWTLTAAKSLYPSSCTEFNAVKAAWDAVSVPAQTADPTCSTGGTNTVTVTNPGSQSGTVGTAASLQLVATDSQAGQSFTWSATGLPAGLSLGSSSGLVSGTPTAAGTYSVTVTATDTTGASGSATFTWTISGGGGGGGCSGQLLGNEGFESGNVVWSASSGVITNSTSRPARTGSWKAWLDGYGTTHTDMLSQAVSIPSGCSATLSFYIRIDTSERTTTRVYDTLTVKANSTTLATYSNLNKNSSFLLKSFNLSSFAGQTVTISFTGVEDSSLQTSFVLDDTGVTLG
ncbi:MAG: M4 family metallopeptidase [Nocardioides sp.]